jgi:DNA polymerase-3 subunit delta'
MNRDFDNLLLHKSTKTQLQAFITQPANSLLVSGPSGSGKKTIARQLAATLLGVSLEKLSNHPYFVLIEKPADKSEIPIDAVRKLIKSVGLKAPLSAGNHMNRVALLQGAQLLSAEAQNALLKLLEEPPTGTLLILTAVSEDDLLPTVASRTQKIKVINPGLAETLDFFKEHSQKEVEAAWWLSQGGAGLLSALLSAQDEHPLKTAVNEAKQFLSLPADKRLIFLQAIAKDKDRFNLFLDALSRVLGALHAENLKRHNQQNAKKILQSRQALETAIRQFEANANTRLLSLSLGLNITV